MNFDYREKEKSIDLPLFLTANLDNKSNINFRDFYFNFYVSKWLKKDARNEELAVCSSFH